MQPNKPLFVVIQLDVQHAAGAAARDFAARLSSALGLQT
jgi:hypothetical protein